MNDLHLRKLFQLFSAMSIMLLIAACSPQEDDGSPIEFVGSVTVIEGDTLTVGGFSVDISNASVPTAGFTLGDEVRVTGLSRGSVIAAVVVVLVTEIDDTSTPDATAEVSEELAATDVPDEATEAPESTQDSVVPTATNAPIVVDGEPILVIEGPVQVININTITIFDIEIQVDPADPVLTQIRIGDTIRIEGQSSFEGTTIIIIAINITVIETSIIVINNPVYVIPGIPRNCSRNRSGRVTCKRSSRRS